MFIRHITYVLLISSLIFTGPLYAREPEAIPDEAPAPTLRLPDLAGKSVNLQDFKGQVVLVNFWASWCPPCREEMPSLWKLLNEFRGKPFRVIAVNMAETKTEVNTFLPAAMKRDFVVLMDRQGEVLKQWKVPAFPTSYVIDKRGRLRYRLVGPAEWDSFDNKELVKKLLTESN
ncbi:MAG: TlpA family protein disulfide reductase [Acidiferrobacterales bacterium]